MGKLIDKTIVLKTTRTQVSVVNIYFLTKAEGYTPTSNSTNLVSKWVCKSCILIQKRIVCIIVRDHFHVFRQIGCGSMLYKLVLTCLRSNHCRETCLLVDHKLSSWKQDMLQVIPHGIYCMICHRKMENLQKRIENLPGTWRRPILGCQFSFLFFFFFFGHFVSCNFLRGRGGSWNFW